MSIIGSSCRRSYQMNVAQPTAAIANSVTMRGDVQPAFGPSITAYASAPTVTMNRAWPTTSSVRGRSSRDSLHEAQREEHDEDADRHVDEEDAAPAPVLDEDAAERGTDRGAHARDRGPDADRARLVLGIGKRGADERERRHVGGGGGDALHAARDVQHVERGREAARDRRHA